MLRDCNTCELALVWMWSELQYRLTESNNVVMKCNGIAIPFDWINKYGYDNWYCDPAQLHQLIWVWDGAELQDSHRKSANWYRFDEAAVLFN